MIVGKNIFVGCVVLSLALLQGCFSKVEILDNREPYSQAIGKRFRLKNQGIILRRENEFALLGLSERIQHVYALPPKITAEMLNKPIGDRHQYHPLVVLDSVPKGTVFRVVAAKYHRTFEGYESPYYELEFDDPSLPTIQLLRTHHLMTKTEFAPNGHITRFIFDQVEPVDESTDQFITGGIGSHLLRDGTH